MIIEYKKINDRKIIGLAIIMGALMGVLIGQALDTATPAANAQEVRLTTGQGPDSLPEPSDPDRDYYDQYNNRYKWDGTLLEAAPQIPKPIQPPVSKCANE